MIGLRAKERLVKQNMELIESNLAAARELFQRHSDVFEFREPAAGSIAFPRLRTGEPILEFCERLVKGSGGLPLLRVLQMACAAGSISSICKCCRKGKDSYCSAVFWSVRALADCIGANWWGCFPRWLGI